jgi:serine/threonine protein phosphatase PrpC
MEAFAQTDPGGDRPYNQDGFGCFPEVGFFVVVDGMGSRWSSHEVAVVILDAVREAYARGERSCDGPTNTTRRRGWCFTTPANP